MTSQKTWTVALVRTVLLLVVICLGTFLWFDAESGVYASDRFSFVGTNATTLASELREKVPVGASREYVDELLVSEGGAVKRTHETRPFEVQYLHRREPPVGPNMQWTVVVSYDSDDRVHRVSLTDVGDIHPRSMEPNDDPTTFRFEDYASADALSSVLKNLFPLDSPKAEVEKVLVVWQYAKAFPHPDNPQRTTYQKVVASTSEGAPDILWNIEVSYLADSDRVSQILVTSGSINRVFLHDRAYWLGIHNNKKQEK